MSFRCIKAFMHAFSGRFSRTCLEGISFKFFVCFIFNVSLGSAPKRKNFDIQRNTRVASGGQFTLNYHTPSHICWHINSLLEDRQKHYLQNYQPTSQQSVRASALTFSSRDFSIKHDHATWPVLVHLCGKKKQ